MMGDRSDDGNLETTRDSQSRFLGRPHTWGDSLHGNSNPRIHASQHDRCGYACLLDGCPLPWDLVHETADIPRRVPVLASFCAGVMAIRTTLVACVPFHLDSRPSRSLGMALGSLGMAARVDVGPLLYHRVTARKRVSLLRRSTRCEPRTRARRSRPSAADKDLAWRRGHLVCRSQGVARSDVGS